MVKTSTRSFLLIICIFVFVLSSSVQAQTFYYQGCSLEGTSSLPGVLYAGNLYGTERIPFDDAITQDSDTLNKIFGTDAAIFYMVENGGPNAFAMPNRMSVLLASEGRGFCCHDGTIALGVNLIRKEYEATGGTGLSIPAILAHEHAHIAQFKYNAPIQGMWRELHADYLAGWYIRARENSGMSANAYQAMANFYYKGDYAFNSPDHHGRPEQRAYVFKAGYNSNSRTGVQAYNEGLNFVVSLYSQPPAQFYQ